MENSFNYDIWFDYIKLEESVGRPEKIRNVYERAVANIPPLQEKRYWRRYIYLWIYYAVWEESEANDQTRAKQVYQNASNVIIKLPFTFAKFWTLYAKFHLRQHDIVAARKTLGLALGRFSKEKLFKEYIALELSLREFDRARTLYEKYLSWNASNCTAWIKAAELERALGDTDRCRGMFDIAIQQPELDMPEVLWKSFIDFETEEQEWSRARSLYERLLERTGHIKVRHLFSLY